MKVRALEGAFRLSLKASDAGLGLGDPPLLKIAGKANSPALPYSFWRWARWGRPIPYYGKKSEYLRKQKCLLFLGHDLEERAIEQAQPSQAHPMMIQIDGIEK